MTDIFLIRHAPTDWNVTKRLQGLSNVPLSTHSREWIKSWQIPETVKDFQWLSSPLSRARETAESLKGGPVSTSDLLMEMDFGDWEGEMLRDLRLRLGQEMQLNEDRGLDFTPPKGESPRMVQNRLRALLHQLVKNKQNTILVTHHGVMRAIMALAFDWPMLGKAPVKFKQGYGYLFEMNDDLSITAKEMHIPLLPIESPK